jgi:hypothetical protein
MFNKPASDGGLTKLHLAKRRKAKWQVDETK